MNYSKKFKNNWNNNKINIELELCISKKPKKE